MPGVAFRNLWIAFPLIAVTLSAQNGPVISPGGIVNAASYNLTSTSVAPGSIATIFGANLSSGTLCFTPCGPSFDKNGVLIPTLVGVSVTFNGIAAPVLSVPNSTQISVQVPVEMAGSTSAAVIVTVNGQSSSPVNVPLSPLAPGLFTVNASGSGQGSILNGFDANEGVASLAAPWFDFPSSHSAQIGDVISIYATGLGALTAPVATGTRPPADHPQTATMPKVTIGGIPATVQFSGEAPCCVGLNQINVTVPGGLPPSVIGNMNAVPVVLTIGGQTSNAVTIARGRTIGGLGVSAQSLSGSINGVAALGLDLDPGATSTGRYTLSGNASNSAGQTVYSVTGSGSGTVPSCLLGGSTGAGNWTASGTMTITVNSQGPRGELLGSFTASTSITLCGTPLPTRITNGGVVGGIPPDSGSGGLILVLPLGGPAIWPLTGTVDTGVSGMFAGGAGIFGGPSQVTGSITVTSSLQSSSSGSPPVYSLTGSGSGTLPCSLLNPAETGTGNWSISVSSTFTLSPPPASLVSTGGSVSGTMSDISQTGTGCTGPLYFPKPWPGGTVIGTVFPGGGIILWPGTTP